MVFCVFTQNPFCINLDKQLLNTILTQVAVHSQYGWGERTLLLRCCGGTKVVS